MSTPNEERLRGGLEGTVVGAGGRRDIGVLVLAGSSGRVDVERARLLARAGARAVALRWFGGAAQPPGICEVPLETFVAALDWLVEQGARRIGIVGQSKGAEAALLVACRDPRVMSVVAISPSSVAWASRRGRAARPGGLAARSRAARPGSRALVLRRPGADDEMDTRARREPATRGRTLSDHSAAWNDHRSNADDTAEPAAARQDEDPRGDEPHADDLRDDARL